MTLVIVDADVEKTYRQHHPRTVQEVDIEAYIVEDATWQTEFLTQYSTLTRRAFVQGKDRYLSLLNLGQVVIMILAGLEWFQLERTEDTMNDRLSIVSRLALFRCFLDPGTEEENEGRTDKETDRRR